MEKAGPLHTPNLLAPWPWIVRILRTQNFEKSISLLKVTQYKAFWCRNLKGVRLLGTASLLPAVEGHLDWPEDSWLTGLSFTTLNISTHCLLCSGFLRRKVMRTLWGNDNKGALPLSPTDVNNMDCGVLGNRGFCARVRMWVKYYHLLNTSHFQL